MKRLAFPFDMQGGRLQLAQGVAAGQQALKALVDTQEGELPLSRDYGSGIEYNVPLDVARAQGQRISDLVGVYHPEIELGEVQPVLTEEGRVMDWRIDARVRED